MKKFKMMLIIAVAAMGFIGCGEDTGTTLKWTNSSNETVKEIIWKDSNGTQDQIWSGDTLDTATTSEKDVQVLSGLGECQDSGGNPATISLSAAENVITASTNSAQLKENADARLIITQVKKK